MLRTETVRALMGFGLSNLLDPHVDCTKGRMTKLWLDPEGKLHPVPENQSHEEWADAHGNTLESLLNAGWVRIQNVPPPYLLIDFQLSLTAAQAKAVARLFENPFSRYVVEFGGDVREFGDGEEAMAFLLAAAVSPRNGS